MKQNSESSDKIGKHYMQRKSELEQERSDYEPLWRDIGDYMSPRSYRFKGELTEQGKRMDDKIINIAPRLAVRTLASGMQSGITSPMRPWFRLTLADSDMAEFVPFKLWLSDVERAIRAIMSRSNIYDRLKSTYGTLGTYGTSALWLDEDAQDAVRAHDFLTGSYYLASNAAGFVNTLHRDTTLTTTQMLQRFGKDRVSQQVRDAYDRGNYNQKFDIVHIVEPNMIFKPSSRSIQHKRMASVWLDVTKGELDSSRVLAFKGYDEQPFMAARWDVIGENTYGVGCGDLALGDSKQLQLMEKRKLQGIDKNVRPPMVADASLRNQRVVDTPGDTTFVNGLISAGAGSGYRPAYQVNPYLADLKEEIMRVEQRVDEAFYKNLFLMVTEFADQPNITATQINTMREEKLMMLGPVLERLNDELLDPIIDRCFNIAMRNGMIPPAPEELEGQELKVEYVSVMAQAQKAMGIGNIERFVGFVGSVSELYPEARDKVNIDEVIEEYADGVAVTPKIVNPEDKVAQMRSDRAEQQQQAQQMEMAAQGVESMKTLSETDVSQGSAMQRAMEVMGG